MLNSSDDIHPGAPRHIVLVTHPLVDGGLTLLQDNAAHYELIVADGLVEPVRLLQAVREVEAIIPNCSVRIDDDLLAAAPRLRIVANCAVGYDNVDVAAATRRGVWVTNTPGVLTEATADLTWALILAAARHVVVGDRMVREGRFTGWGPTLLLGADLAGKTLGVIGLGQIGHAVARRALGFAMRVIYHDVSRQGDIDLGLGPQRAQWVPLEELLRTADIVTLHTLLSPATHHLIDAPRLALMKPSAILVNTSRGPVVDERALVEHLRAGRLRGAALDVYEAEPRLAPQLAELDTVVLLPHLGSATVETRQRMAQCAAENVHAVLGGGAPLTPVNQLG
jgi:glyoxylate reductase